MTDFANEAPQVDTGGDAGKDYESLYRAEVQARIAERERYKPFAQAVGALDAGSCDAIIALAQAAAEGDVDAIADWTASTYRNLRGADLVNAIAEQQTGQSAPASAPATMQQPQVQQAATDQQFLTIEQAAEIARREAERTVVTQNLAMQIANDLNSAGYPVDSAPGQTIIRYAQQTGLPIADAIAWYDNDLQSLYQRRQQAGAQIVGSTPMPSPTGSPAAAAIPSTASPRERAIARLNAANRQPGS